MFVLNEQKLAFLLKEISGGFQQSPLEIAIFSALVIGFLCLFIFAYRHQAKKSRIEHSKRAQELFDHIIDEKGLNMQERHVLELLSGFLPSLREKNMLLENRTLFNTCLKKIQQAHEVPPKMISSIRKKLGFQSEIPDQTIHSSTDLSENLPVLVITRGKTHCPGILRKSDSHALHIELREGCSPPGAGTLVTLYFQRPSGIFSLSSRVTDAKDKFIEIAHTETIKRIQRRRFYRKKTRIPAFVKLAGSREHPVRSILTDLGGGGATLVNPGGAFHEKDELVLFFRTMKKENIQIRAKVLRISDDEKSLHVAFHHISEAHRDRIYKYLFKK
jgi:hypothetical protein